MPLVCHHVAFGNQPGSGSQGAAEAAAFIRGPVEIIADDGCAPMDPKLLRGKVAVIRRGQCPFSTKALHAYRAQAVGVVLVNNRQDDLLAHNIMSDKTTPEAQALPLPIVFVDSVAGQQLDSAAAAAASPAAAAAAAADGSSSGTMFEIISHHGWASFGANLRSATTLMKQNRRAEAVNYLVEAVRVNSWDYYASKTLGQVLYETGDLARAKFIFEHVTNLRPRESYSHIVLGSLLAADGLWAEARKRYHTALAVSDQDAVTFNIQLSLATLLPRVMPSAAEAEAQLRRTQRDLDAMAAAARPISGLQTPTTIPSYLFAYYASGTTPDGGRRLYETLGEVMRRTQPSLNFVAPHVPAYPASIAERASDPRARVRVGFLSSFFRTHTLMQLFLRVIEGLPRNRFEVVILDLASGNEDATTARVRAAAAAYVRLPQIDAVGLSHLQNAVAAQQLDVLVLNDIGLSQHTWLLSFSRFAPVQCLTLSNGMTSGLPTIDYYVSTVASQPGVAAQAKYSEALVLLDSLYFAMDDPLGGGDSDSSSSSSSSSSSKPTHSSSSTSSTSTSTSSSTPARAYFDKMQHFEFAQVAKAGLRRRLGLRPSANVYVCFQGLFKLHPTFDAAVLEVLRLDPDAVVVFMHDDKKPAWTDLIKARLRASAEALASSSSSSSSPSSSSFSSSSSSSSATAAAAALTALRNDRVVFAPKLPHAEYLKFVMEADVHLDPFPFGGGLTTAELLGVALPVVTLPGPHRSGRLTTAMCVGD